jgi:hypothetical protein
MYQPGKLQTRPVLPGGVARLPGHARQTGERVSESGRVMHFAGLSPALIAAVQGWDKAPARLANTYFVALSIRSRMPLI